MFSFGLKKSSVSKSLAMFIVPLSILSSISISTYSKEYIKPENCKKPDIGKRYFISAKGDDKKGNGSRLHPWNSINHGLKKIPDGNTLIVKPGIYDGTTNLTRNFKTGILIRSEYPYEAILRSNSRVLKFKGAASNIHIQGFNISHFNQDAKPLVIHIDGGAKDQLQNITIANNIIHDSFNNDLLKVNNGATYIKIKCNLFYNQGDSDEHIDVNSAERISISDNIFFNSFESSNRKITSKSSSYIVIKDSNSNKDQFLGSRNITVARNVFLNWQGSIGHGFILVGEDGKEYYEANKVFIFNNLFLGNSTLPMRSPFGIKGAKNIHFFNNTITGDLPSNAFSMRINREGNNPINDNIFIRNNIWSDPNGTMGSSPHQSSNDFSDTIFTEINNFEFKDNLIWNGGNALPHSLLDKINPSNDASIEIADPMFKDNTKLSIPIWIEEKRKFADGSFTIREVFERLVYYYGKPQNGSLTHTKAVSNYTLKTDILGNKRNKPHSRGAYHIDNTPKSNIPALTE
ncbi:MAG: hypothetical protein V7739_02695 [Motiliproteus sp.]